MWSLNRQRILSVSSLILNKILFLTQSNSKLLYDFRIPKIYVQVIWIILWRTLCHLWSIVPILFYCGQKQLENWECEQYLFLCSTDELKFVFCFFMSAWTIPVQQLCIFRDYYVWIQYGILKSLFIYIDIIILYLWISDFKLQRK